MDLAEKIARLERRLAVLESHNGHKTDDIDKRLVLVESVQSTTTTGIAKALDFFLKILAGAILAYLLWKQNG